MAKVKPTREVKEQLISLLQKRNLVDFFVLLDTIELDDIKKAMYEKIKNDFLKGRLENDYLVRLEVFVNYLDEEGEIEFAFPFFPYPLRLKMSDLFSLSIALIIVVSIIGTLIYVFKPSELSSNNESKSKPTANNSIDSLQKIIEKQNDLINKHIKNNNKPNTSQVIMYDYVVYGVTGLSVLLAISGLYVAQRSRKKVKELEENYSKKEGITDNEKEKIVEQTAIKVVSTLNN